MDHVFMVMLDWSTTDADGFQIELFKNYDDAYDRFKEIISEQLKEFWDGEVNFDIDGDPGEEYEFSEEDNNSGESEVYQSAPRKTLCNAGIFPENAQSVAMLRHSQLQTKR